MKIIIHSAIVALLSTYSLVWIYSNRAYLGYKPDVWFIVPPAVRQVLSFIFGFAGFFLSPLTVGGKLSTGGAIIAWSFFVILTAGLFYFLKNNPQNLRWVWLSVLIYPLFIVVIQLTGLKLAPPRERFAGYENPIYGAVMQRDKAALQDLVDHKITPDLEKTFESSGGDTPLLVACSTQQMDIAKILVQAGANIFTTDDFGINVGLLLQTQRLSMSDPQFASLEWLLAEMKRRSFPFPAPTPDQVKELQAKHMWPPTGAAYVVPKVDLEWARAEAKREFGVDYKIKPGEIDETRTQEKDNGYLFWGRKGHEEYESPREFYPILIDKVTGARFYPDSK